MEALARDFTRAPLDPADRTMLEFAAKLTRTPAEMVADDVERLRAAGFDDRAIHDLVLVVGYFAFVNRVVDGLGVEPEANYSGPGTGWGAGGSAR